MRLGVLIILSLWNSMFLQSQSKMQFHFGSDMGKAFINSSLVYNDTIVLEFGEGSLPRTQVSIFLEKELSRRLNMRLGLGYHSWSSWIYARKDIDITYARMSVANSTKEIAMIMDGQFFLNRGIYVLGGLETGIRPGKSLLGIDDDSNIWTDAEIEDMKENEGRIRNIALSYRWGFGVKFFKRVGGELVVSRALSNSLNSQVTYGGERFVNSYRHISVSGNLIYYFQLGKSE